MIPDFNPIEKPLSYFGVAEITAWYWNLSLIMISFAIYLNAKKSLPIYFKKLKTLRILRILLTVSLISLFFNSYSSYEQSFASQYICDWFLFNV